jgi:hypothetical protein
MNLDVKFKLLSSSSQIERDILKACEKEIRFILDKAKRKIHAEIINIVIEALQICPEINSLRSGKLKADFGLQQDPTEEIIYAIANSTEVSFKNFKLPSSKAALTVYIQPTDFNNLLSKEFATVITQKGQSLPWLSWMLLHGDSIIISEYHVEYGVFPDSRSGDAIMKPGKVFKVDSSFSGSPENNFITRALSKYENQIKEIIGKSI